jgi:hypothetical protein
MENMESIMNFSSVNNFSSRYLQTYYLNLDLDEIAIGQFLVEEYKKIGNILEVLEIGCGPTIHHLIPAVPYAKKILMADFLKENLDEIRRWILKDVNSHNWSKFTEHILKLENDTVSKMDIQKREEDLRAQIKLTYCDLMKESPLNSSQKFQVVSAFYCAEEVGISIKEWEKVMHRISSLVKPGGYLLMCSLLNTDFYQLINSFGEIECFPSAKILPENFLNLLPSLGFLANEITIRVQETPEQSSLGVLGTIMLSARMSL